MNCNFCDNKATVFLTQVLEEELKKVCLCDVCTADEKLMSSQGLSQFLSPPMPTDLQEDSIIDDEGIYDLEEDELPDAISPESADEARIRQSTERGVVCECGFSLADYRTTGRLGCNLCYTTMRDYLAERVESSHRGASHVGKQLYPVAPSENLQKLINAAQEKLEQAIAQEDFEQAASLRDQIDQYTVELSTL